MQAAWQGGALLRADLRDQVAGGRAEVARACAVLRQPRGGLLAVSRLVFQVALAPFRARQRSCALLLGPRCKRLAHALGARRLRRLVIDLPLLPQVCQPRTRKRGEVAMAGACHASGQGGSRQQALHFMTLFFY